MLERAGIYQQAKYRADPPTEKQIRYLQHLRASKGLEPIDAIEALKMTKQQAYAQIEALKP